MNTSEDGKIEKLGATTEAVTAQAAEPVEDAPDEDKAAEPVVEKETVVETTEHTVETSADNVSDSNRDS